MSLLQSKKRVVCWCLCASVPMVPWCCVVASSPLVCMFGVAASCMPCVFARGGVALCGRGGPVGGFHFCRERAKEGITFAVRK